MITFGWIQTSSNEKGDQLFYSFSSSTTDGHIVLCAFLKILWPLRIVFWCCSGKMKVGKVWILSLDQTHFFSFLKRLWLRWWLKTITTYGQRKRKWSLKQKVNHLFVYIFFKIDDWLGLLMKNSSHCSTILGLRRTENVVPIRKFISIWQRHPQYRNLRNLNYLIAMWQPNNYGLSDWRILLLIVSMKRR